jgi:3-deoxy-D-manno-octulosonate 8-phosphate phosphatase (KDO 8-P phosphatase)
MIFNIAKQDLQARLTQIRLLAMDVDGVLTDGGLYYNDQGEETKRYNVKDGQGLKLVMAAGIEIAIVSAGASPSILHRARALGITQVFVGVEDKLAVLKDLCARLDLSLAQVAYIGDDVNDLPILQEVGCPLTVADAMPANRAIALCITAAGGGQGAVRELCDYLLQTRSASPASS